MTISARQQKKLVFLVNDAAFFLSHRYPIAQAALQQGYEVHLAAPSPFPEALEHSALILHRLPWHKFSQNPLREIRLFFAIILLLRRIRPDLLHCVTIKAYLYGGIAARICRIPALISAVSGLGLLFEKERHKSRFLRAVIKPCLRFAFGHHNQRIIFQNAFDLDRLTSSGLCTKEKSVLIAGSGVCLDSYIVTPEPKIDLQHQSRQKETATAITCKETSGIIISMAARLLKNKGVFEFVEAARRIREKGIFARFWLIGDIVPGNPQSLSQKEFEAIQRDPHIESWGYRQDVAQLYARSHIVCLPSYYGEGLPKSLIEAAACGRPIVTTTCPGCRDAVDEREKIAVKDKEFLCFANGILVPPRNAEILSEALRYLTQNQDLRQSMGQKGRLFAQERFAIEKIIQAHLTIYDALV